MPPRINIPEDDYPALDRLIHLSQEEYSKLVSAIESMPLVASPLKFPSGVADRMDGIDRKLVAEIVNFLYIWCGIIRTVDVTIAQFADDLQHALEATGRPELTPADADWTAFNNHLRELLSIESLRMDVKAFDLYVEDERTYHDVSIITSVRPVFRDNPDETLAGALVLHTLALEYHVAGEVERLRILLDKEGIDDLRQALNRAESKANNLKHLFMSANIPVLREDSL